MPCFVNAISEVAENAIAVGPNPSAGIFTILGCDECTTFEVYSLTGELILSQRNNPVIDLSDQADGCYFLRVVNGTTVSTAKLVVQH